jgi:hypothetical protein
MNGLTVIATNNGWDYLEKSLEAEKKFGRWPVYVIDTCSSDESFREAAWAISKKYNAGYIVLAEPRYDFGAYYLAWQLMDNHKYDAFWFKHDSLYLKSSKFYDVIEAQLKHYDMIGWHFFAKWGSSFDNEEQRQWLLEKFGSDDYDYGFYGPNFAIKRETLVRLRDELDGVVIDTKMKQQAMERGWSILAKKHKMKTMFLEHFKGDVKSEAYEYFIKAQHTSGAPRQ